ncbi:DUF5597 domain-containing protein [Acidipila sp. EB88]|uniref:DUF5597 domain-containing protein n=1 Tax=Acidipila sp. EB88 TaxID=2305226 RepID=UPI001F22BBF8|nr:DUF5597 domain-containing protein [Acidipila sp. EB88]
MVASLLLASALAAGAQAPAGDMPRIEKANGRSALIVDGKPYFMLGAQINNSSSWAATLPDVWPAFADLHANTIEAPVYWELMERQPGQFDFSNVDLLIRGAREHHLHLVLLWFGTWKNGQNHYVPEWVKSDPAKYPREQDAYGKTLDVMSPLAQSNLDADKHAFAALMHHVREIDSTEHTVIMMQVENESGSVGAIRDYSPDANREFAGQVPAALHTRKGSWSEVYGADADERFAAYATAHYINAVAEAGKAEYPLPMYCNVWITYPVHALSTRNHPSAGQEYPSGGPQQANIDIWKQTAPSIDMLGPDFYSNDRQLFRDVVSAYGRPDNPLFIPETHMSHDFGANLFYVLGHGGIGFSPFGVDYTNWTIRDNKIPDAIALNYAVLGPLDGQLAQLNYQGKLQTAVELKGEPVAHLHFGGVDAVVAFGFPQHDGEVPPGTTEGTGRVVVAQLGPLEFLVTGFDASVTFEPSDTAKEEVEILQAEQGTYSGDQWQMTRIWNGDQTDRGLQFRADNHYAVRVRLQKIATYTHPK